MTEKPILFSGEMVRAILDGRKTQTRRVVKPQPIEPTYLFAMHWDEQGCRGLFKGEDEWRISPYGSYGDRLWVRETWAFISGDGEEISGEGEVIYKADSDRGLSQAPERWRPSIHMPRWASRITLEVTGIRVERLREISEEDAIAEGVRIGMGAMPYFSCLDAFKALWDSINGKRPGCSWEANPWVWPVEFRRVEE